VLGLLECFFWTIFVFIPPTVLGLLGYIKHPGLPPEESDQIFSIVMGDLLNLGGFPYFIASILLASSIAAIMSTTDSLLMAISSIVVVDFIAPYFKTVSEKALLRISKIITVVVVAVGVVFGVLMKIELKNFIIFQASFLMQTLPGYLVGSHSLHIKCTAIITGIVCGVVTTIILFATGSPLGIDPGICGFLINCIALIGAQIFLDKVLPSVADFLSEFEIAMSTQALFSEPLKKPWIWAVSLVLALFSGNFYRVSGQMDRFIIGFPVWAFTTLVFAGFWAIFGVIVSLYLWEQPPQPQEDTETVFEDSSIT